MRALLTLTFAGWLAGCVAPMNPPGQLDDELAIQGTTTSGTGGDVTPMAPHPSPTLRATPSVGTPGTQVTVTGSYFAAGSWAQLQLASTVVVASADRNGRISTVMVVPAVAGGSTTVTASASGALLAHTSFFVLSHGMVTLPRMIPGIPQSLGGSGFPAGRALVVGVTDPDLHRQISLSPVPDANGNFSLPITIEYGALGGTWRVDVADALTQTSLCATSFFVVRPLSAQLDGAGNVVLSGSGFYPGDGFVAALIDPAAPSSPFGQVIAASAPAPVDSSGNLTATVPLPAHPTSGTWAALVVSTPVAADTLEVAFTVP